jgi:hypothetical protein
MWPFTRSPENRMHHRLLKRLRFAYLVGEDLSTQHLLPQNLRLIGEAQLLTHDDPVLYQHWFRHAMPSLLSRTVALETQAWQALGDQLHGLYKQQFYPDYFAAEAAKLIPHAKALQELLHLESLLLTRESTHADAALLASLTKRVT